MGLVQCKQDDTDCKDYICSKILKKNVEDCTNDEINDARNVKLEAKLKYMINRKYPQGVEEA